MPDQHGYPTRQEIRKLEKIAKPFPKGKLPHDLNKASLDVIEHLESIWHWPEWGFVKKYGRTSFFTKKCIKLELHTGGWSGNETIIGVLELSWFWHFWWVKSVRGGHYYFEIPELKKEKPCQV